MRPASIMNGRGHVPLQTKAEVARGLADNTLERAIRHAEWGLPGASERLMELALKYEADAIRYEQAARGTP